MSRKQIVPVLPRKRPKTGVLSLQKKQETIIKGVGNIDPKKFAMAFTTESNDFKVNTVRSINMSLNNSNQPVLFVLKKNGTSLWLGQVYDKCTSSAFKHYICHDLDYN